MLLKSFIAFSLAILPLATSIEVVGVDILDGLVDLTAGLGPSTSTSASATPIGFVARV